MSTSSQTFQQKRITEAGSLKATAEGLASDIHQSVELSQTTDGALSATVDLWNIARDSWRSVSVGDPFRVGLGYHPSPFTTVFFGVVKTKHPPERDDAGLKYQISGEDQSAARLKAIYRSHTWTDPTIAEVVAEIAARAGLSVGSVQAPGSPIGERWPICKENCLAHWLDQLVREADDKAEEKHEWHADGGRLHFHPRSHDAEQAVQLSGGEDGNTIRIDESTGSTSAKKTSSGNALDFEAFLDPRLRQDGLVAVDTQDYSGVYRVSEYSFTSSTENGDHLMEGTLEPTGSQYVVDSTASPAQAASTYGEGSSLGGGGFQQI